jgi:Fur family transcriptional regulator, ferric uptake regulator
MHRERDDQVHVHDHKHVHDHGRRPSVAQATPAKPRRVGARQTDQRRAISAAMRATGRPLRPEEVLAEAQDSVPGLGIATVYRALKALVEAGELRVVELPGDVTRRYELADLRHHHHFHCERCDRVFDIDLCPGDLSRHAPAGFVVTSHELLLHGSCERCNAPMRDETAE